MSLNFKFLKYLILSVPLVSSAFAEKKVTFCVDQNTWFPHIMTDKSEAATGALVDIAKIILEKMHMKGEFKSTPWSRCTSKDATAGGEFDGIISPSFKQARADFINYPPNSDAEKGSCSSIYKAVCAKYVFVVAQTNKFEYKSGAIKDLGEQQPIRAPNGYSVVADLNNEFDKAGVKSKEDPTKPLTVEIGSSDHKNLQKLSRDGTGVAILDGVVADGLLSSNTEFKEKLRVVKEPYVAKSNYIAFYKSSKNLTEKEQHEFWEKLAELAKNKAAIDKIYANPDYDSKNLDKYILK